MKKRLFGLAFLAMMLWNSAAYATFVSGSTGALGAFNPTSNIEVVLPTNGVLNYTTVNIPSGVTVTFTKNAANTPVYMLATGDVIVAGTINVNGGNATSTDPGKGGPGGFDGGYGGATNTPGGKGFGPGGGNPATNNNGGAGGGFGGNGSNNCSNVNTGGLSYGNVRLLPLIGGSGGGGGSVSNQPGGRGGGGGGAIVIASSTSITVTGTISANGGNKSGDYGGGGGSGGGIKLVADVISGNGTITATRGYGGNCGGDGGPGRIRIEATTNNRTASTDPVYSYGLPSNVFVANPPSLSITSIAGTNVPATPTGSYSQPDIFLPNTTVNPVAVNISATNIPVSTAVKVWVLPRYGSATSVDTTLSGTDQSSTGTASVTISTSYANVITAEATFTIMAMYYNGEEIDKVHVATTLGGKSETTYITRSGKEIKGELVAALLK